MTEGSQPISAQPSGTRKRFGRFLAGLAFVEFFGLVHAGIAERVQIPFFVAFGIYSLYIVLQCVGLTLLARRLVALHNMQQAKVDIGSVFIVTTMVALSFGYVSILTSLTEAEVPRVQLIALYITALVMLFPCLMLAEATAVYFRVLKQRLASEQSKEDVCEEAAKQ